MERLAHIDALRGSAAILLIFQALLIPLLGGWALQHALDPGLLAILWFLLCCGFVVPASLHASADGGRGFAIRRLLRLLPVYLLAVLLTAILLPTASAWLPGVAAAPDSATAFEVIGAYGALPPILLFYGLCLLLQVLGLLHSVSLRASCALLLLAVALLLVVARQLMGEELPVTLPLVLSLMFFASLRYEAKHESSSYARRRAREYARYTLRVYLLVLPIIFLAGWTADENAWPRDLLTYALAIVTFLMVTSRLPLRAPPLVWLGSLSYSLYLLLPAMHRLSHLVTQALGLTGQSADLAGTALGLLLALGSAQLCRQLLDLPVAHAGKRLTGQHNLMPLVRLHGR